VVRVSEPNWCHRHLSEPGQRPRTGLGDERRSLTRILLGPNQASLPVLIRRWWCSWYVPKAADHNGRQQMIRPAVGCKRAWKSCVRLAVLSWKPHWNHSQKSAPCAGSRCAGPRAASSRAPASTCPERASGRIRARKNRYSGDVEFRHDLD